MRANNKVAKKRFEDLVVEHMEGLENVINQVNNDMKHANGRLYNVYQAGYQMAQCGFFECYYANMQDAMAKVGIVVYGDNLKDHKRYCHFMALAVERLYEANTKAVA